MDLIPLDEGLEASWDQFCSCAAGAWFWHRRAYREYTLAYRPQAHSRSLAFAVRDGGELVAAVPLMVEQHDDGPRFSFGGGPCWSPAVAPDLPPHRLERALNEAFDHVDELALAHGVRSVSWRLTPLANDWGAYLPFFLAATTRAGYIDISLTSTVVEVSRPIEEIRARMTKGHRSAITAAGRAGLSATVLTGADAGPSFDAYRSMHARAAGRVTRPARTFELMKEWLVDEQAALVEAQYEGAPAGFAYLALDAGRAYYGSAANEPEIGNLPVGQCLQNAAITWLNARGFELYELGLQQFGELPYDAPSSKDLGLARFKRGFGGILRPLVTREKKYSVGPEDGT